MANKEELDLTDAGFSEFFKSRKPTQTQNEKPNSATTSHHVTARAELDGRLSNTVDRNGYVQLNVRVPIEIKNLVIEERARRRATGQEPCDVGGIVAEALREQLTKG